MAHSLLEGERLLRTRCLAGFLFPACLLAYSLAGLLRVGNASLAVLVAAALLNLAAYAAVRSGPRPLLAVVHRLAPIWGVATWTALIHLEGGVSASSFFVVGFWFEILLAAVGTSATGVAWVGMTSVVALCGQQAVLGFSGLLEPLVLQTSSLVIAGAVAAWIRSGWDRRLEEERLRLRAAEDLLADSRALAELGARSARLGHGLKNAVHSLRGFSSLIEKGAPTGESAALRGLKGSIDQLELLARASLRPRENGNGRTDRPDEEAELREILDAVVAETALAHPDVRYRVVWEGGESLRVPRGVLTEVLSNLLRNAAESMQREGEVTVSVERKEGGYGIRVTDRGPGIPPGMERQVFRPGYTSKENGHGLGLYLARGLMEAQGGGLSLEPSDAGASFRIRLPESWGG